MSNPKERLSEIRAERIAQMVGNLLPRIRPLSGDLSEDELLAAAAYMAIYRVADEEAKTPDARPEPEDGDEPEPVPDPDAERGPDER